MKNIIKNTLILVISAAFTCPSLAIDSNTARYVAVGYQDTQLNNNISYKNISLSNYFPIISNSSAIGSSFILTSNDGATWDTISQSFPNAALAGVASDGNKFIATGMNYELNNSTPSFGGVVLSSTDGATWSTIDLKKYADYLYDISWNGKMWVAIGGKMDREFIPSSVVILTSNDGKKWQSHSVSLSAEHAMLTHIAWNSKSWVVIGDKIECNSGDCSIVEGIILASNDGKNWKEHSQATENIGMMTGISWNNNAHLFAATSIGKNSNSIILTSNNGTTWTNQLATNAAIFVCVNSNNSQFTAIASSNTYNKNYASISNNGKSWDAHVISNLTILDSNEIPRLSWLKDKWFLYGSTSPNTSAIYASSNGIDWEASTFKRSDNYTIYSIAVK